jgi:acyl carrier protein
LPSIVTQLKQIIVDDLKIPIASTQIDADAALLEDGLGFDSITLFEFITLIEQRFEVLFPVDSLNSEVFASLNVVAQRITALREKHAAAKKEA